MHILTKFLVVFAAVLSIFLAALTIAYSANADRITASLSGAQADRQTALAALQDQNTRFGNERMRFQDTIQQLTGESAKRDAMISQLQSDTSRLMAEKNKAESERQTIAGKIAELGELAKTQATLITSYKDEVSKLRENELKTRSEMLALEAKLSDVESQNEVRESTIRALQEQLAEAKLASGKPVGTSGIIPGTSTPFAAAPVIQGRIDQVTKDTASDAMLARINVGTNDQVQKNMKFMIVRNGEFLGNLVVEQTDLKWSVGRINTLGKAVEVRQGDTIQNGIR